MSTTPHVTVIIPTYNRSVFLVEAIESVLAQSYQDYELVVANGGSTDDTAQRVGPTPSRLQAHLGLLDADRPG
jgi:GT2 family glycosyltransferase